MKAFAFVVAAAVVCAVAFGAETHSGTSGDLSWEIKDDTLTITGTGSMSDCGSYVDCGWKQYVDDFTKVVIKDGATNVGGSAFENNAHVNEITIAKTVNILGSSAFSGCTNLTKITISGELTVLESSVFYGAAMKEVSFVSKNATLSGGIFSSCPNLETVVIKGASVKSLPVGLFSDCPKLMRVVLPFTYEVDSTPSGFVFSNLPELTLVYYAASEDPCYQGEDEDEIEAFSSDVNGKMRYVIVPTYYNSTKFCGKYAKVVSTTTEAASSVVVSALVMLLSVFLYLW